LHFTEIYFSQLSRTYQIENKRLFNFREHECFLKHSNINKVKEVGWANEKE